MTLKSAAEKLYDLITVSQELRNQIYSEAKQTLEKYYKATMLEQIESEENFQILEEILAQKTSSYDNNIRNQKLKFSKRVPKKKLEETLEEVKVQVDEFLGINPKMVDTCKVSYPGFFDKNYYHRMEKIKKEFPLKNDLKLAAKTAVIPAASAVTLFISQGTITPEQLVMYLGIAGMPLAFGTIRNNWLAYTRRRGGFYWQYPLEKEIVVTRTFRESLVPLLAHEYTHHIKRTLVNNGPYMYGAFDEGLAMGTENYIARLYSEKEGNKTFEYDSLMCDLETLAKTYTWLCQKSDKRPNKSCAGYHSGGTINQYDIGNTYFTIESAKKGKTAYKDALHELVTATWLMYLWNGSTFNIPKAGNNPFEYDSFMHDLKTLAETYTLWRLQNDT